LLLKAHQDGWQTYFIFKEFIMIKGSGKFHFSSPLVKAAAFLTCFTLSQPAFAQAAGQIEAISKMQTAADSILEILTGSLVRAILAISLCACAVVYATNKDNEKVKRGCLAIGISGLIIMSASSIVRFFMPGSN
jgi:type IV secretory pathway VirB2 component (pilin)